MGNRAVITTKKNFENNGIGVYLHWNGGRDSVESFLKYCELKGYRTPDSDGYGWARLCQIIGNFFGGTTSLGIDVVNNLDCTGDNGTYIIEGWEIVDRKHFNGFEQDEYDMTEMLVEIDKSMPADEQLGEDYLRAKEVLTSELEIGDVVFIEHWDGKITKNTVVGFGKDEYRNGTNVKGLPYVDLYENDGVYSNNINNYIRNDKIKIMEQV